MAVLPVVFATLLLQALWGSASSSQLGAQALAASDTVNEATEVSSNEYCYNCIKIDNVCYNHTQLFELNAPFGLHHVVKKMGIMKSSNTLYYTFEPKFNDPEYSKAAYVTLHNPKNAGVITGWQAFNFGAIDINQNQDRVYLGGSDGIWFINYYNPIPTSLLERGHLITNIVVKQNVYYTKTGTPGIIKNVNGNYQYIVQNKTIKNFVLDKDDKYNVVYLTDTGLFILFNSKSQTVKLHDDPFIRGLTVDTRGAVYAWNVDGIHKVVLGRVLSDSKLKRVSGLVPDAMVFDKDNNIIYSKGKTLYQLTIVRTQNCRE